MAEARTVAFHTLGCKLNFSETSTLSRMLENEGFEKKEFDDQADVYVINTCSVTDNADKECRQIVRRIQRKAPESLVVITGCYAQLKPKQIAEIPGVNLGDFGIGPDGALKYEENFFELVQALEKIKGIQRYRISSIEPNLLINDCLLYTSPSP